MTELSVAKGNRRGRRWLGRASLAAAMVGLLVSAVGAGTAFGAVSTVGGACAFHVGAPFETGAAGSFGFEVPVYPANPHQTCQATVTVEAALAPAAGGSYTNVATNPNIRTVNLDFAGGPLPLGVLWVWSPHCADPAAPGVFTATVDGQSSSLPVPALSCALDLGGHSSLSFDFVDPVNTNIVAGMAATTDGHGYWTVSPSGVVQARGDALWSGDALLLSHPAVGIVADPTGHGYWVVSADGGVFSFGGAPFFGSLGNVHLAAPIVGMAAAPGGTGYWLVGSDGGVFSFGNAVFHGSLGNLHLAAPIVGVAATKNGTGYWLVGSDGGVFSFGNAVFHGSLGNVHLAAPVVGITATPDGGGYWLAAYDGGVFTFGDAIFHGSAGALNLAAPVFGMARTPSGLGYWLVAGDGGIFTYGDAGFFGSSPLEP